MKSQRHDAAPPDPRHRPGTAGEQSAAGYQARDVIVGGADGTVLDDAAALKAWLAAGAADPRDLVVVRNQARARRPAPRP